MTYWEVEVRAAVTDAVTGAAWAFDMTNDFIIGAVQAVDWLPGTLSKIRDIAVNTFVMNSCCKHINHYQNTISMALVN